MSAHAPPTDDEVHDPMPEPPPPLDPDACCGQGCDFCVLEMQAAAMDRYRAELAAWRARHGRSVKAVPLRGVDRRRSIAIVSFGGAHSVTASPP